jgi:hypothetical protein
MAQRLELQALLVDLLGSDNVYFQPPAGMYMEYPCIVYGRNDVHMQYADNSPYKHKKRYQVTYMGRDPDSDVPDKLAMLPLCSFDRHFKSDDLNHDVYNLYF